MVPHLKIEGRLHNGTDNGLLCMVHNPLKILGHEGYRMSPTVVAIHSCIQRWQKGQLPTMTGKQKGPFLGSNGTKLLWNIRAPGKICTAVMSGKRAALNAFINQ